MPPRRVMATGSIRPRPRWTPVPVMLSVLMPVLLVVSLVPTLSGCVQETERVIVIPDSTLIVVLADLHLADARARLPDQAIGLRDTVLAFHGLNEAVFQQAMDSFDAHPAELTNLYNTVLDKLNAARSPTQ